MKKNFIRTVKIFFLILPIVLFVIVSQTFCFYNASGDNARIDSFYTEAEDSLDVVLLGASELYAGYSSGLAYAEYGFTSYSYVTAANPPNLIKSQLIEVLKHQSPNLIIIEVNTFLYGDDSSQSKEANLRKYIESVPMSSNKIDTISEYDYDDKLSCFVPFIKYHGNWKYYTELSTNAKNKSNRMKQPSLLKGNETCVKISDVPADLIDVSADNSKLDLSDGSLMALLDLINYCKENELNNVVFARFPHMVTSGDGYKRFARSNKVGEIVSEHGFKYINFESKLAEIGIDIKKDFYDPEHLNVSGQEKMTRYLCETIMSNFSFTPKEQSENNKAVWEKSVEYSKLYIEYIKTLLPSNNERWIYETVDFVSELERYRDNNSN